VNCAEYDIIGMRSAPTPVSVFISRTGDDVNSCLKLVGMLTETIEPFGVV
jgi:hypothetical protein